MAVPVSGESVGVSELKRTVLDGGYCVGCGACAALDGEPCRIALNDDGCYVAFPQACCQSSADPCCVCPLSDRSIGTAQLAHSLFAAYGARYHDRIGYYVSSYAGHVTNAKLRADRTSGGYCTWLLLQLFKQHRIDGVIHVRHREPTAKNKTLFHYVISTSEEQIASGSRSSYYPVEMSEVLQNIKTLHGRYAIVATPLFVRAVRLLCMTEPAIRERIRYCIGLMCGHLKSAHYADILAWQLGIEPDGLRRMQFREKSSCDAGKYRVVAEGIVAGKAVRRSAPIMNLYGTNWGLGLLKCIGDDYSDDVVGELADVSIGDAWMRPYRNDPKGTNIVVIRHPDIQDITEEGLCDGHLALDRISPEAVAESQRAGFLHRREGLIYRLSLKKMAGAWHPPSRVQVCSSRSSHTFVMHQRLRLSLSRESYVAFRRAVCDGSFFSFVRTMNPLVWRYAKTMSFKAMSRMLFQNYWSLFCFFLRKPFLRYRTK
ncbi:MAG: Coenzyme F420 hydrogenase/dehydrogenase, beta subunit C-terminal domain [Candidatus Peribacteraceae bacterium]|nr:Coenzyme F420 hydrogenase/dehydrogenase, beta subunit C-terminal domain [Candidatus Peribacteraceae bacterium]